MINKYKKCNVDHAIFLGGIFTDENYKYISSCSNAPLQNAADSLQKKYIQGLELNNIRVDIVNLPFITAFSKNNKIFFYKKKIKNESFIKKKLYEESFLNLPFFRLISRFWKSFFRIFILLKAYKKNTDILFFCYSMHLPFMLASVLSKAIFKRTIFVIIVPDLPEHMSKRKGIKKYIGYIMDKFSYVLVRKFDVVVPITKMAAQKINIDNCFVIEGLSDINNIFFNHEFDAISLPKKFFFYSGTLDSRYGVKKLVDSFINAKIDDYYLVICGAGEEEKYIINKSINNKGVMFLGQVERELAKRIQLQATFLVNPRENNDAFTKYSFPSKVMEYMSSGTPVLMYKLDGIPKEYYEFCYIIDDYENMEIALQEIVKKSCFDIENKGLLAKEYVLNKKNPKAQIASLINYIGSM